MADTNHGYLRTYISVGTSILTARTFQSLYRSNRYYIANHMVSNGLTSEWIHFYWPGLNMDIRIREEQAVRYGLRGLPRISDAPVQ